MKNQTEIEKVKDRIEELVIEVILAVLSRLKDRFNNEKDMTF
jgi:hypothetical protein